MFPNEEYMKTAFNGVSERFSNVDKRLNEIDKNAVQSDWQENDPTAPSYVKNRMGGYDVSQTIEKSAEYPTDGSVNAFYIDRAGDINWYADQIGKDTEGLLDALQLGTVEYHYRSNSSIQSFTWTITDDYAYTNEKMANNWPIAFALFNTTPLPVSGFEGITEPGVYVLRNDFTTSSSIIDALFWTYTETKTIQIPEKYIPDAVFEKDTMVVKFTPTGGNIFAYEANYSIDEIYEAYGSGKVIIKGALLADGYTLSDGTCEVNDTCICFKFVVGGIIVYVLMDPQNEKLGYAHFDGNMLRFESDSNFTLKVTAPGWNGQIYAQGKLWKGSQISSVYFDGKYRMYLYGANNTKITGSGSNHEFVLTGSNIRVAGNLKNLLDYINSNISMLGYCFNSLFESCTALVDASDLEMMLNYGLSENCYMSMFQGCTSLVKAPELPATTLANYCYGAMFQGCTSLVKAPELPATTLANYCYGVMFQGCTSLQEVPKLSATTLETNCYMLMFQGCTSLKFSAAKTDEYCISYRIPFSGTGTTADGAVSGMFNDTGGTFTGTPSINATYYLHKSCSIVGMTDDPKPVPKTDEMTQPVGMDKWTGELFTKPGGSGGASIDLGITGATAGQVAKVKTVDDAGKPTEWEAASIEKGAVEITCNAADYGVSPDAADNSASLLLAIQAAQEQNAVVYIPEGEYIFTTPITLPSNSNIQMIGSNDAFASSMNRENVSGEMHPIASGTTLIYRGDGAFMRHTGCVFSLKNLQLVSQDANKAYLYKARAIGQTALDNTTKGKIYAENCLFAGWKTVSGDAFVTSDLETALGGTLTKPDTLEQCCIVATRCRFSFCGAAINMGVDSRLVDCSINKCYYGAAFYGSAGFSTLSNCRIEWCAYDGVIGNQAHDILISGCEFDRCGHAAVRLTSCTGCTIAGNVMRRSGADSTVSAESSTNNVHLYIKSCTGGAITGNTTVAKNIMDDGSSTTKRPTNAYSITDNTDLTITGNDFSGRTTGTYNKLSGNTDCHLSANIGMENDSASNLSLGLTGATPGQIAKITAVDENGKPTAWEPADLPSGGGGDWVFAGSVTAESAGMALKVSNIHAKHILVSLYASCDDTSNRGYNIVFNDVLRAQHANSLPGNSDKHLWAIEFDLLAAGDENYIYIRVWPNETHHTNTSNDPQTIVNITTLAGTMWYKVGISEFNSVTFASTNGTASAGNIMNVWYR